jgi:uncharacterized alpha-E superfamily protein
MLGKTAGGLFWMYRYFERAENTARLIETGQRIALTRAGGSDDDWASVLQTAAVLDGYRARHESLSRDRAIDWMLRDPENPSAVLSVIGQARNNARLVRTALTHEVWEAVNGCWMDLRTMLARKVGDRDLPRVLERIRNGATLLRGATYGTMLRNDIYNFARIGNFIERADNTGRILDVKYYVLLPTAFSVGSSLDNAQWDTILRSVSGRGGFRMVYGHRTNPRQIAEYLVLDKRMPRSLHFCAAKIGENLGHLEREYGARLPAHDMADALLARFGGHGIDSVFDYGLHETIQEALSALSDLSRQIEIDYRFYE